MTEQKGWRNRIVGYGEEAPDQLLANPRNWRIHPKRQQDALAGVLDEVGWVDDVIVNKTTGYVVDGHLRVAMAISKGVPTIPVKYVELSEEEEAKILATLDPLAALAVADAEILGNLLEQVSTEDEAVQRLLDEIAAEAGVMVGPEPPEDPGDLTDRAEELQEKWQVKQGDVWEVGGHLVVCGDCRELETWERLLSAAGVDKVNGVFTSPPYAEQRKKQYGGTPVDEYVEWWEAVQENVRASLADDGSFFVNIKPHCEKGERVLYVFDLVLAMKRRWGWRFVDELCWHKSNSVPGRYKPRFRNAWESVYHWAVSKCKCCFQNVLQDAQESSIRRCAQLTELEATEARIHSGSGSGFNVKRQGMHLERGVLPSNVIYCSPEVSGGQVHSGTFPITLPDFFIRAYSDPGDVWLDPFQGSGTTIVAAHQNERRGLGIELLEKYVSVTLERLEGLGLDPRLLA